jgi:Fe-S cluster biosynthesis and repair protein YggX
MMANKVQCVVLKKEAEALDAPPHPGALGQRIFENVSKEGWKQWLERLTTIINENGLNTADPKNIQLIEKHMLGFFFDEGDYGQAPAGFKAGGGGGKK